jgi:hypothetical protein
MRIPLRLLGLTIVFLLVGALAVGLARPPAASAATPATGSLSSGEFYSCALRNGQAYCWGNNAYGQLGDGTPGSAELPVAVRRATSRTSLALSASSVRYGHEMSLTITVAVAPQFSGTPAGNVVVTAGRVTLCTVRLASGTHTCSLPSERALSPGRRVLVATYWGSADFVPSTAAKTLTVQPGITPLGLAGPSRGLPPGVG